jgi:large subunit ribosomal protein L1
MMVICKLPLAKEGLLKSIEELRKTSPKRKFVQSVEFVMKLREVDLKKSESRLNEAIELPNPLGKTVKICVFAGGDLALRAKKEADEVLGREDLEKMAKDKKAMRKLANEYDHFIAEAPLMPIVGKTIGSVLGPRGKMPTPVPPTANIEDIVKRHRKIVRVRVRDQPAIRCRVATEDMPDDKIIENIQTAYTGIEGKLERGSKNVGNLILKTTMGPPVKVSLSKE